MRALIFIPHSHIFISTLALTEPPIAYPLLHSFYPFLGYRCYQQRVKPEVSNVLRLISTLVLGKRDFTWPGRRVHQFPSSAEPQLSLLGPFAIAEPALNRPTCVDGTSSRRTVSVSSRLARTLVRRRCHLFSLVFLLPSPFCIQATIMCTIHTYVHAEVHFSYQETLFICESYKNWRDDVLR